jgi:hypothetical protein
VTVTDCEQRMSRDRSGRKQRETVTGRSKRMRMRNQKESKLQRTKDDDREVWLFKWPDVMLVLSTARSHLACVWVKANNPAELPSLTKGNLPPVSVIWYPYRAPTQYLKNRLSTPQTKGPPR